VFKVADHSARFISQESLIQTRAARGGTNSVISNNCAFGSRSCPSTSTDGTSHSLEQVLAEANLHNIYDWECSCECNPEVTKLCFTLHFDFVNYKISTLYDTIQLFQQFFARTITTTTTKTTTISLCLKLPVCVL
jgi:hypothetical protein